MTVIFRQEQPSDYEQTERIIKEAFKSIPVRSGSEHEMVKRLRGESTFNPIFSQVAILDHEVIGHIILSKVYVNNDRIKTPILNLQLVSVIPHKQRQGIGKALIKRIISIARDSGNEAIIVLGHPTYYHKIGFKRASTFGLRLPFEVPDESFFALELKPHSLADTSGTIEYQLPFWESK